ncbi:MAG: bis(5'-nucleosyl)-tetraphosphatase [Nitrososphaerales archaeon]
MIKETSAGAVVYFREANEIKYLLLNYTHGHWDFPKGHINPGEHEVDTVRREVQEETGIDDLELFEKQIGETKYSFLRRGNPVAKRVVVYLAQTRTTRVRLSREHKSWAWLGFTEALSRLTYPASRNILEAANKLVQSF